MKEIELLDVKRKRKIPEHFSWIDHRLVRDGHFKRCSRDALSLYLFLVSVGDEKGMSWYGSEKICEQLNCEKQELEKYREELIENGLIAYERPYYQVLDLSVECYGDEVFNKALRDAVKRSRSREGREKRGYIDVPYKSEMYRRDDESYSIRTICGVIKEMLGEE